MIIEFSTKNFRSFKDLTTISFEAEPLKAKGVKVIETEAAKLLPAVAIFGPNSSGKSNMVRAISYMQWAVKNANFLQPVTQHAFIKPFLLNSVSSTEPSFFQISLLDKQTNTEYQYGFELNNIEISKEWFSVTDKAQKYRKTRLIFRREYQVFTIDKVAQKELDELKVRVLPTSLAIAVFAQFAHKYSYDFVKLMAEPNLVTVDGTQIQQAEQDAVKRCITDDDFRKKVLSLMQKADFGILDFSVEQSILPKETYDLFPDQLRALLGKPEDVMGTQIYTVHKVHDKKDVTVNFNMLDHESLGTRRYFALAALLLPILESGGLLVADELDSSLHPFMTKAVVDLFLSSKTNPNGAQLLFTTHETYLLSKKSRLRRDQIWFIEKNLNEESILHCLAEYKTRSDYEIVKNYLDGRFGAVPVLRFEEE